jgi:hypothetical protein
MVTVVQTGTALPRVYSGPIIATKCGNGVIDPAEDYDPGSAGGRDCCSARRRLDAAGTPCATEYARKPGGITAVAA